VVICLKEGADDGEDHYGEDGDDDAIEIISAVVPSGD
jgi:hypothetical protein